MSEHSQLYWDVLERLTEETGAEAWADLVEAAFCGPSAIEGAFQRVASGDRGQRPTRPAPAETWLTRIELEGFRGIGPQLALELPPGPGLTVIKGRNGTGKSSLAEGLEVALTGQIKRIKDGPSDWKGAWRNLHHRTPRVTATLSTRGAGVTRITRRWVDDADIDRGQVEVTRAGARIQLEAGAEARASGRGPRRP